LSTRPVAGPSNSWIPSLFNDDAIESQFARITFMRGIVSPFAASFFPGRRVISGAAACAPLWIVTFRARRNCPFCVTRNCSPSSYTGRSNVPSGLVYVNAYDVSSTHLSQYAPDGIAGGWVSVR
jgi:hypothetical protein